MRAIVLMVAGLSIFRLSGSEPENEKMKHQACCEEPETCCKPADSDKAADATKGNVVHIEYLYLDASTCERCKSTASVLEEALKELKPVLEGIGKNVQLEKIHIRNEDDAKKYKFMSSPTVRINGQDAAGKVEENECGDCGCICDGKVNCRTWSWKNKTYEVPPKGMIIDAVLRAVYTKSVTNSSQYALPENLKNFFAGVKNKTAEEKKCECTGK